MENQIKSKKSPVVTIHSQVTLKGPTGEKTIKLVEPEERDIYRLFISVASPFGQVLINKKIGDLVQVRTPDQIIVYEIVEIV